MAVQWKSITILELEKSEAAALETICWSFKRTYNFGTDHYLLNLVEMAIG